MWSFRRPILLLAPLLCGFFYVHTSSQECVYTPNVTPQWRETNSVKLDTENQFPLEDSEILLGFPSYNVNKYRLAKVIDKIINNQPVVVGMFGGSFAKGNGCSVAPYQGWYLLSVHDNYIL